MSLLDEFSSFINKPLLIIALVLPTTRTQRTLIYVVILLADLYSYAVLVRKPGPKGVMDYIDPTAIAGNLLSATTLLVLTPDARTSIRRRKARPSRTETESHNITYEGPASQLPFWRRVFWACSLAYNPRLVGTNEQALGVPPLPPSLMSSRKRFCLYRLFIGVTGLLALAAMHYLVIWTPYIKEGIVSSNPSLLQLALHTTLGLTATYLSINAPHCLLSALVVALGMFEPEEWPPMFGAVSDAYMLRRVWGRCWHQLLRKPLRLTGVWAARSMGAGPGSFTSRYVQLLIAFVLLSWQHSGGDFIIYSNRLPSDASLQAKFKSKALFSPQFFMVQAVGVVVEDAFLALARRVLGQAKETEEEGRKIVTFSPQAAATGRILGYVWVFAWFCATFPPFTRNIFVWVY